MPELMFDTQEAVPEAFRSIAAEKDGKFSINVVPKAELDTFRDNNLALARERDGLKSFQGRIQTDLGLDPEKIDDFITDFTSMRDIKQQVEDGKLVADTSLAAAVEAKTGEMKRSFEHQITELKTANVNFQSENSKLKSNIERSTVDGKVLEAINDPNSGALPNASRQILREASEIFSLDEHGDLVAKDNKGNVIYGTDGATPLTPKEFLVQLEERSPFFFKASQGGGAGGSGNGNGGGLTPAAIAAMSPEERMNYGRQTGQNR